MALFPAWLIAFLGLLPSSVGLEYDPLPRSALLFGPMEQLDLGRRRFLLLCPLFTYIPLSVVGKSLSIHLVLNALE
jgi:hypothetical protein